MAEEHDPIVASYTVYITPPLHFVSTLPTNPPNPKLLLLQYPSHRPSSKPYNQKTLQKPTSLRIKSETGLLEVDIPIDTRDNYNREKGANYGKALKKSRIAEQGGSHGLAGGFNPGAAGRRFYQDRTGATKGEDMHNSNIYDDNESDPISDQDIVATQTLGGKIVKPESGDPIYMLGAFRGSELHLSHLDALVQVRPQLHHLDASDELERGRMVSGAGATTNGVQRGPGGKPIGPKDSLPGQLAEQAEAARIESKAVDIKYKGAEDDVNASIKTNQDLLLKIQSEPWQNYGWVDDSDDRSYNTFDEKMHLQFPVGDDGEGDSTAAPRLESVIGNQDWLDKMSAPRQVGQGKKSLMLKVKGRERERARRRKNDEIRKQKEKEIIERGGLVSEIAGDTEPDSTDESELSELDPSPPPDDIEMTQSEEKDEVMETTAPKKPKGRPRKSQPADTMDIGE